MENLLPEFNDTEKRVNRVHDFEEYPIVIGILKEIVEGSYGKQLVITDYEENNITIGTYAALSDKVLSSDVGKPIKISYLGKKMGKNGREFKDFDVWIK